MLNQLKTLSEPTTAIHPATRLGVVEMAVADLTRSVDFYTNVIGLRLLRRDDSVAVMGVANTDLLHLRELPDGIRQPTRTTGLYHVAILLPSRPDLGRFVINLARSQYQIGGFADHLVSEAIYLDDPDGNGLEVYRDRPRSEWPMDGDSIRMATDPIDLDGIVNSVEDRDAPFTGQPDGTTIGHMHLRVGDTALAEAFYHRVLGFDIVTHFPGASFLSAGGYHHHLGANTWQSSGAPRPPENAVGLRYFTIIVPDAEAQSLVAARLDTASIPYTHDGDTLIVDDPWGIRLHIIAESAA